MLARKMALIFGTRILTAGVTFIGFTVIVHYLGSETLGIVAFAAGFVGLLSCFGDLGLNDAHIKHISQGKDLGRCNGTYFLLKGILILATILFVFVGVWVSKNIRDCPIRR